MVTEKTSQAIVLEIDWLVRGQRVYQPSTEDRGMGKGRDEFGRPLLESKPAAEIMGLREATAIANERAQTGDFQCPEAKQAFGAK
jgi:hypothetical protein